MDNFFYSNLCHTCKRPNKNLKRCSNCKFMGYCCREHQKHDWKQHKELCNLLKELKFTCKLNSSYSEFTSTRLQLKLMLETRLNRQLYRYETQLCLFPRICNICYSQSNLKDCENCLNVSHCCPDHDKYDEVHKNYCNLFKLGMFCDIYYFKHGIFNPNLKVPKLQTEAKTFPHNFLYLFNDKSILDNSDVTNTLTWDYFAPGATIIHTLELCELLKNRHFNKESLAIHLVGANDYETYIDWNFITEFMYHWIIDLKEINIILIGPELYENIPNISNDYCDECKQNQTNIERHKKPYHSIVRELKKPDIVIGFNSGIHEYENTQQDTWHDSLNDLLLYTKVPLLLTAYTEDEIIKDSQRLCLNNCKFIQKPEKNPYANRRPMRDWCSNTRPIFYVNGYYIILIKD